MLLGACLALPLYRGTCPQIHWLLPSCSDSSSHQMAATHLRLHLHLHLHPLLQVITITTDPNAVCSPTLFPVNYPGALPLPLPLLPPLLLLVCMPVLQLSCRPDVLHDRGHYGAATIWPAGCAHNHSGTAWRYSPCTPLSQQAFPTSWRLGSRCR